MKKDPVLSQLSFLGGVLVILLLNGSIIYTGYSAYVDVKDGYTIAAFFWALTSSFLLVVLFSAMRREAREELEEGKLLGGWRNDGE